MNQKDSLSRTKYTFCVGMRRGGSTLQTQLVSAIIGRVPMRLVTPETLDDFLQETKNEDGPICVKCHRFLPQAVELLNRGDAKIVYTYRDVRDVVASIAKKYNIPQFSFVHGGLTSLLDEYRKWSKVPGIYIAKYETMISDVASEAIRLAEYLGVTITAGEAHSLAEEFSVERAKQKINRWKENETVGATGQNAYDPGSLLHSNHIQSGGSGDYMSTLSPRIVAALEWEANQWLLDHDYEINNSRFHQWFSKTTFSCKASIHNLRSRLIAGELKGKTEG